MSDPLRDISISSTESLSKEATFWIKELDLAAKREKKWRKKAEEVWELYEGGKKNANSFNILYANTETLLPACYNQLPRPIVDRRFRDADPLGKAAGETLQRTLSYLMDSPEQKYSSFSDLIEQAVLAALVPGRGATRFRYEPEFEDSTLALGDADEVPGEEDDAGDTGESEKERAGAESGESAALFPEAEGKRVAYETICGEDVPHDGLLLGYARRWKDTPWIAFYHAMTEDDLEANFGEELAAKIKVSPPGELDEDGNRKSTSDEDGEKNLGSIKTADVYEIWHKASRTVVFFSPQYDEKVIKTIEDPLKLSGFFPIPAPLVFLRKGTNQTPVPPYELYEEQAKELNLLSKRINKVASAIKVRGFYDKTIQGIDQLLTKDDNTLIPAMNVPALQQGQTLEKSIWLMPLEELIAVLKELINAREACKATIYEITGIADLMRGDSQASETATAQSIKDRWGSLRVKRLQRYVQEYVRECLRIMGELAGQQFAVETFAGITGLDFATDEQVAQAEMVMEQVQQAAATAPPDPQSGQPALPPELQQQAQQAQQTLGKIKWSDIKSTLESDLQRGYKIDIETNSTIDATSQEDKQNINEAMTAIGAAMQQFVPAAQAGVMTLPAVKTLLLAMTRRFEFGKQVEDAIMQMPDQLPAGPDASQVQKMQQQVEQAQQKVQQKEQDLQQRENELQMAEQQFKAELAMAKKELALEKQQVVQELKLQQQQAAMDLDKKLSAHQQKMDQLAQQQELANQQAAGQMQLAAKEQQNRDKLQQREMMGREKMAATRHKEMLGAMTQGQGPLLDTLKALAEHIGGEKEISLIKGLDGKTAGARVRRIQQPGAR